MRNSIHVLLCNTFLTINALLLLSCNHHDNSSSYPNLELHEETIHDFKIKFLLPSEYTKELRVERSDILGDKTMMMDDSSLIFFSTKERRSFFAIQSYNFENDFDSHWYTDYLKGGEAYVDSIMTFEQLSDDKGFNYRMPLVKQKKDKHGHPLTAIQYITRYSDSYPEAILFLKYEAENEQDSVEAIFNFRTIIGTNIIECYYYSLDSYENFSYEKYLKIMESITVDD